MKSVQLTLMFAFLFVLGHAQSDEIVSGKVMCSTTTPVAGGFDLVKVRKKDRDYSGAYEFNDLKVSGTYRSSLSALQLEVGTLDEDGEVSSQLLSVYTKLRAGEHFRAKIKKADSDFEIYCYFLPETKSK